MRPPPRFLPCALAAAGIAPLALACPAAQETARPVEDAPIAARTRIAGYDALRVTSRVTFAGAAARPHTLDATFAFPARARLALRAPEADRGARILRYRRGAELFGYAAHAEASTALTGAERDDELLGLEARLAVFLYPEAHPWTGTGDVRRAELPGLGALEVHLAPTAVAPLAASDVEVAPRTARLPQRVRALRRDGSEVEALDAASWADFEGRGGARPFPRVLTLHAQGTHLWREELETLDTRSQWSDAFFVPPDRRPRPGHGVSEVQAVDVGERWVRDVPLPEGVGSLAAAAAHGRSVLERERARGLALAAPTTLVVDATLTPRALRLELTALPAGERAPPAGWLTLGPEPAWVVLVDRVEELAPRHVAALTAVDASAARSTWLVEVHDAAVGGARLVRLRAHE